MPEMDGLEATVEIRKREEELTVKDSDNSPLATRRSHIPITAMTAHAMAEHRQQCADAGMDDYVSKQINPEEFIDAIERQLSSHQTL